MKKSKGKKLKTKKLKAGSKATKAGTGGQGTDRPTDGTPRVKRPPLVRMKKILVLLQAGRYPNCTTMAAALDISVKSVGRDLDYMRDGLELPIEYDDKRHGFYLTRPVEGFPMVPVTAREIFEVCVAHNAIEHYRGTPLERPLELAYKRMAKHMDDEELFTLQSLDEVLSFRPFAPVEANLEVFEVVTRALTERRGLGFEYKKPDEKPELRRVRPYHLMEFGGQWYLLAYDLKRMDIRKFVLGRMRDVVVTEERFTVPKDFSAKEYFKKSLGVMTGTGDYQVVIEMDAWLTDIWRGRRLHPSQEVKELPGAGSQIRVNLGCLEEIEQHVLSWGTHAHVVGPKELRDRVAKTARAMAVRYEMGKS